MCLALTLIDAVSSFRHALFRLSENIVTAQNDAQIHPDSLLLIVNKLFTVVRLLAIVPISSATVERVFSQVKFILDTIGDNALEETLEVFG